MGVRADVCDGRHGGGLPVRAGRVPGALDGPADHRTGHAFALAVRVAAELGADFVKTPYVAGFEQVTAGCYVPVVVLGGAKRGAEAAMLGDIEAAMQAGGAGVAIGRNIFQAEDPACLLYTSRCV